MSSSPKVLISYAWDTSERAAEVKALADWLRVRGIDVVLDQYLDSEPPSSWPAWMSEAVKDADFVLVVASPAYLERSAGRQEPGTGLGATWEWRHIQGDIYRLALQTHKYIPCALTGTDLQYIPEPLEQTTHFVVGDAAAREQPSDALRFDIERLFRRLTGTSVAAPKLGPLRGAADLFSTSGTEGPASESEIINWHPQVAYLRGIRALNEGDMKQAVMELLAAIGDDPDEAHPDAREALITALLRQGEQRNAAEHANGSAALEKTVADAVSARSVGQADWILSRMKAGDPVFAGLRQAIHDAVADDLPANNLENQEILRSAGLPPGCSAWVESVESTYMPSDIRIAWEGAYATLEARVPITLALEASIPRSALGELTQDQQLAASGDFEDDVWTMTCEVDVEAVARVPYAVQETFGDLEVELPDLGSQRDW